MLKYVTGLLNKVIQCYKDEIKNYITSLDNIHTVSHVIHELLTQYKEIYVVVDGVNKCLNGNMTLITLHYLIKMPIYGLVKWLFTSRDYPKIRSVMKGVQAVEIKALTKFISLDIRFYFSKYIIYKHCINK
jgi:uncharacterized protein (DUF1330 family)